MITSDVASVLREVLADDVWREHFAAVCEDGVRRLHGEAGRYRTLVSAHGVEACPQEVRAALRQLAVLLHPASVAAREIALEGDAVNTVPPDPADEEPVGVSALPDTLPYADAIPEPDEGDDDRVEIRTAKDLVAFLVRRCSHDWGGYFERLCRTPESLRIAGSREFYCQSRKMGWEFTRDTESGCRLCVCQRDYSCRLMRARKSWSTATGRPRIP